MRGGCGGKLEAPGFETIITTMANDFANSVTDALMTDLDSFDVLRINEIDAFL